MSISSIKPRLTHYDDVRMVVDKLTSLGTDADVLAIRVTEVGPVDLDLLNLVLESVNKSPVTVSSQRAP